MCGLFQHLSGLCIIPMMGGHLSADEAPEVERVWCEWNNNGQFYKTRSMDGASDFHSHLILSIQTLLNVNVGEEQRCNCGSSHEFNG